MGDLTTSANGQPISIVYNGTQMDKLELMMYLSAIIKLKKNILLLMEENERLINLNNGLRMEAKERTIVMPVRHKPTGFAALSPRKRREYQQWLAEAPQREQEFRSKQAVESARIQGVKQQIEDNTQLTQSNMEKLRQMTEELTRLLSKHIIAPDYRSDGIPEILLNYLFNGRAHTLTEAINLYHEEQYRGQMLATAEKQRQQAERAALQMQQYAQEQLHLQQQHLAQMEQLQEEARKANSNLESIRYYQTLEYLSNL